MAEEKEREAAWRVLLGEMAALERFTFLVLGDSVSERVSKFDADGRTLKEMFRSLDPGGTAVVSYSAFHAGVFSPLVKMVKHEGKRPSVIVTTVNIRSMTPQWMYNPLWSYDDEIGLVNRYIKTGSAGLPAIVARREPSDEKRREYEGRRVYTPLHRYRRIIDFYKKKWSSPITGFGKRGRSRALFVFHYGFHVEPGNSRLESFHEICRDASEMGSKAYFYMTPVNYQAAIRFAGKKIEDVMDHNAGLVREAFGAFGDHVHLADYTKLLGQDCFFHENLASEHLNEKGRAILFETVSADARKLAGAAAE